MMYVLLDYPGPLRSLDVFTILVVVALVVFIWIGRHSHPRLEAEGTHDAIRPPHVHSRWPWLGNMIPYAYSRSAFLRKCMVKHGPIFRTKLAGRSTVFMTSPALITALMRRSQQLTFYPVRALVHTNAFGMSVAAAMSPDIDEHVYPTAFHPYYSKQLMDATTSVYAGLLLKELRALAARHDGAPFEIALQDLIFPQSFRASTRTSFGASFPVDDALPHFLVFDEGFSLLASGLPTVFFPAYRRARDTLLATIGAHAAPWNAAADAGATAPERNIACEVAVAMRRAGWSAGDAVGHLLAFLWGSQGNALWTMFWALAHILADPARVRAIRAEVDGVLAREGGGLAGLCAAGSAALDAGSAPLLESAVRETMRTSADFLIARIAREDCVLGAPGEGRYLIRKGEWVFGTPAFVHGDPEVYERADEFVMDRFVERGGEKRRFEKQGRRIDNNLMFWGGGEHICKGRYVAEYEVKLFIVLALYLLNPEPIAIVRRTDGTRTDGVRVPRKTETHVGLLHSDEDLLLRCHPNVGHP